MTKYIPMGGWPKPDRENGLIKGWGGLTVETERGF